MLVLVTALTHLLSIAAQHLIKVILFSIARKKFQVENFINNYGPGQLMFKMVVFVEITNTVVCDLIVERDEKLRAVVYSCQIIFL
jgi:hypothetical protein